MRDNCFVSVSVAPLISVSEPGYGPAQTVPEPPVTITQLITDPSLNAISFTYHLKYKVVSFDY